uniref:Uncharacterized protein n=1 Tax=Arundo donax TaxID=35708 RepID=A0A0A9BZ79_ARUDO
MTIICSVVHTPMINFHLACSLSYKLLGLGHHIIVVILFSTWNKI